MILTNIFPQFINKNNVLSIYDYINLLFLTFTKKKCIHLILQCFRIHHRVKFTCFGIFNKNAGLCLDFNTNKSTQNREALCRWFKFGSLLCLIEDNFKSCFFATVLDRSDELLLNGMVRILFRTYNIKTSKIVLISKRDSII